MLIRILICLPLVLSTATALAETNGSGVGVGSGATAVDPSKNVLDSLLAAVTRLNDLQAAQVRREDDLRSEAEKLQNALRDAETRRINELSAQKQTFDLELARINRTNQDLSASLLATQVKELKTDTAERMGKLEEFANQQRGRSSATDPTFTTLLEDVRSIKAHQSDSSGQGIGQANMFAWIVAGAMALIALVALFYRRKPEGT